MKKILFFAFSLVLLTSSNIFSGGDEDLARDVMNLVEGSDFCKALAEKEKYEECIVYLKGLHEEPERYRRVTRDVTRICFPAFKYVENVIDSHVNNSFSAQLNFTENEKKSSQYVGQFKERMLSLEQSTFKKIHEKSVKRAAKKILAVIKNAEFFVSEDKGYRRVSAAVLKEHNLMSAFQEMKISQSGNPLPVTTLSQLWDVSQTHLSTKN